MHTLSGLLLIVLLVVPWVSCQQGSQEPVVEGSGQVGEDVTPSLIDDYVNCPPGDGTDPEKNMMGEVEEPEQEDYEDEDYYDDTFQVPKISQENYTVENATIVLVEEDSLTTLADEEDETQATEGDNEGDAEDSKVDGMFDQTNNGDLLNDYPVNLIRSPKIYNVPDSETPEAKFAAYKKEHTDEIELVSPNFPKPYPDNLDEGFQEFNVSDGIGVQITVHELDLDPTTDFLLIRGGSVNDTEENGPIFTGKIDQPLRFLIAHTTTFSIRFVSQHEEPNTHRGFRLTYSAFGTLMVPTTTTTTEPPVPQEEYQWIRKEISVSRTMMLAMDTWPMVKAELANSTNLFVAEHKLKYKECRPEDIRIVAQKCPDTWPNYEECVTLRFAVPLRPEPVPEDDGQSGQGLAGLFGKSYISVSTTEQPKPEYQLSEANLERMWNDYGAMALAEIGIEAYAMPENSSILLIWIAISLCIVAAFIFVLYSIWKIDFFKDYRRISRMNRDQQDDDRNELKKKEFDISMFPSPHQIVPSFFPTGDPYNDRGADAQYAYDNSTMSPFTEEVFEGRPSPKVRPKQQVFEPLSPTDYSPSIVDFNETPEPRSPRRSRNNPFLPTNGGGGGFNQSGSRP